MIIVMSSLKRFFAHTPAFLNSSGLKNVFEQLRFRDVLVWTVGLSEEKELRFQISPAWYWPGIKFRKCIQLCRGLKSGPVIWGMK